MDAIAFEVQFLDHLAPVWRALPPEIRGTFIVAEQLVEHAARLGIDAEGRTRPRHDPAYPPPRFDGPTALVASYGDVKEGRRLGYGPFAFLEHGAGQTYGRSRNGSYAGGLDREDNTLVMVPNNHAAAAWTTEYPSSRVEIVGCPRLDDLPARVEDGTVTVAISFHWPVPHAVSPYAGNALGDFLPALPELARRYKVIGHAHPKGDWPRRMERHYRRADIAFVADFADVCRQADVYVCDNSSTLFEFASTDRPVVVMNARAWDRKRGPGLRFWEAATVGVNVDRPEDLLAGIERALELRPDDVAAREAALDIVYPIRAGGAELAAQAVMEWLGARVEVAA